MRETRVKTNQIEIQVRDYPQHGEAVVFLHFSGANLMMWQPVVPYFQGRYHIVLVDLRGHGKSDKPESGYHIDQMAADVLGVMRHLNLEQAHLVGSSLGAEVALSLAANFPQMVRSLVCEGALFSEYGPYGIWPGSREEFDAHAAETLAQIRNRPVKCFPTIDAFVRNRQEILEQYGVWNTGFEAMERYDASVTPAGEYTRAFRKQSLEDYMVHYFETRFECYYPRAQCPILMLPAQDEITSQPEKTAIEKMVQLARIGEIMAIDGWQHAYGWLLKPLEASQAVLEFHRKYD